MSKIVVILASYNGEKFIKEQISSILSQTNVDIDLYIFDDCSKDNTINIIKELQAKYSNIFLKVNDKNTGSAALNFLNALKYIDTLNYSAETLYAFSDQDDIWLTTKLCTAASYLQNNKNSLYCSNLTIWQESKNTKSLLKKDFRQKKYDYLFEGGSAGCTYVFNQQLLQKTIKIIENNDLPKWIYLSHDWLIYFIARYYELGVYIDNTSHILYRIHGNNEYGTLNILSAKSIFSRIEMIHKRWFIENSKQLASIVRKDSIEYKIYQQYTANILQRIVVLLKYNFQLMRSRKKFIFFFFISFIPIKKIKKATKQQNKNLIP